NSVGTKQLKDHAVTPSKVASKTIKRFSGQPGKPGLVRAYAYVKRGTGGHGPVVDPARTRGFASVSGGGTDGVYCLTPSAGIDPRTSAAAVTPVWNNGFLQVESAQLETGL